MTSDYGLIPSIVPADRLTWANSTYTVTTQLGRLFGPAAAGVLIPLVGSSWTIWLDAVSFLATAGASLILLPDVRRSRQTMGLVFYREGFSFFKRAGSIKRLTLALACYNLGTGSIATVLLTVAINSWQWSETTVGIALSGGVAMGTLGSWLAGCLFKPIARVWQLVIWLGVCAVGGVSMVVAAIPLPILTGYLTLIAGEGAMNVVSMTYRQETIPSVFAGRVNAIVRMFVFGTIPLSSVIAAYFASFSTPQFPFVPAAFGALSAFLIWGWWILRHRHAQTVKDLPEPEPTSAT